jgi:hypothetical protein
MVLIILSSKYRSPLLLNYPDLLHIIIGTFTKGTVFEHNHDVYWIQANTLRRNCWTPDCQEAQI